MARWTVSDSTRLYNLNNWGAGFFSINKRGNVCVHPSPYSKHSIELCSLTVYQVKNICDAAGIDCSNIISEQGAAIRAVRS